VSRDIEEILAPKPEVRPRIYAYSIADEAHNGLSKSARPLVTSSSASPSNLKLLPSRTTRSN